MNTEPNDKFHGSHPRFGNNVHERLKHDREPTRLGIIQETRAMVLTVGRLAVDLPHGATIHHSTGNFIVDRSDSTMANNGNVMIQPETSTDSSNSVTIT